MKRHIGVCVGAQGAEPPGARRIGAGMQGAGPLPSCWIDIESISVSEYYTTGSVA